MISKGCLVQYSPVLDATEGVGALLLVVSDPYVRNQHVSGTNVQIVDIIDQNGAIGRFPVTSLIKVQ